MTIITTIGLDLAKSIFQIHAADSEGNPVLKKRLLARFGTVSAMGGSGH